MSIAIVSLVVWRLRRVADIYTSLLHVGNVKGRRRCDLKSDRNREWQKVNREQERYWKAEVSYIWQAQCVVACLPFSLHAA